MHNTQALWTHHGNVSIEGKWVGNAQSEKYNDGSSICEESNDRNSVQRREDRSQDSWNRVSNDDAESHHASKGKGPLRNRYGNETRFAEAMLHGLLEGVCSTHLGVLDNQSNRPVHRECQADQKCNAGDQASLLEGVRLSYDPSSYDTVGHVHEGALEPAFGSVCQQLFLEFDVVCYCHAGCFNARQEWRS